jgi:hypothetical protein
MDNENKSQTTPVDSADEERDNGRSTRPRGNPDRDHEEVTRGEDKLERIVGN